MDRGRLMRIAREVLEVNHYVEDDSRAEAFIALVEKLSYGWSLGGNPLGGNPSMLRNEMAYDRAAIGNLLFELCTQIAEEKANEQPARAD